MGGWVLVESVTINILILVLVTSDTTFSDRDDQHNAS